MKIAVFGWYGHDNAGDERIKYCLESFLIGLGGIDRVDFFDLHEEAIGGYTNKFNDYNLVIIGGGGLILSQHNYHDFILGIQTKIVTLGISVETTLKGNPKKFAKALLSKSSAFLVRDHGSYEKLLSLGGSEKVKVSSDLTFLLPYNKITKTNSDTIGINLFPKTITSSHFKRKFQGTLGNYLNSFQPKVLDFSIAIEELHHLKKNLLPIALYCDKKLSVTQDFQMNDTQYMLKYFKKVPESFIHEDINKCKLIFSMRLHGLIFSIQKGIPFITLDSYPKQANLMKELNLSDYLIKANKLGDIKWIIDKLYADENSVLDRILYYREKAIYKIKRDIISIL